MFEQKLIQLHREPTKVGDTLLPHESFCEQREVSSHDELVSLVKDVKSRYDWSGFRMVAHSEGSPKFLMQAEQAEL